MDCEYADIRALIGMGITTASLKDTLNTYYRLTVFTISMWCKVTKIRSRYIRL